MVHSHQSEERIRSRKDLNNWCGAKTSQICLQWSSLFVVCISFWNLLGRPDIFFCSPQKFLFLICSPVHEHNAFSLLLYFCSDESCKYFYSFLHASLLFHAIRLKTYTGRLYSCLPCYIQTGNYSKSVLPCQHTETQSNKQNQYFFSSIFI